MAYKKGQFIIRNAQGVVTLAGDATSIFSDSNNSASASLSSPVQVHMSSAGTPASVTRDYIERSFEFELTPGVGGTTSGTAFASLAALQTAFVLPDEFSQFISSGFDLADLNLADAAKAVVLTASATVTAEGNAGLRVSVKTYKNAAGTVVDFTGAWAATT